MDKELGALKNQLESLKTHDDSGNPIRRELKHYSMLDDSDVKDS